MKICHRGARFTVRNRGSWAGRSEFRELRSIFGALGPFRELRVSSCCREHAGLHTWAGPSTARFRLYRCDSDPSRVCSEVRPSIPRGRTSAICLSRISKGQTWACMTLATYLRYHFAGFSRLAVHPLDEVGCQIGDSFPPSVDPYEKAAGNRRMRCPRQSNEDSRCLSQPRSAVPSREKQGFPFEGKEDGRLQGSFRGQL